MRSVLATVTDVLIVELASAAIFNIVLTANMATRGIVSWVGLLPGGHIVVRSALHPGERRSFGGVMLLSFSERKIDKAGARSAK